MEHQNSHDIQSTSDTVSEDMGYQSMSFGFSANQLGSLLSSPNDNLKPKEVLALQRSHGNQFVQQLMMRRSASDTSKTQPTLPSYKMVTPTDTEDVSDSIQRQHASVDVDNTPENMIQRIDDFDSFPELNDRADEPEPLPSNRHLNFLTIKVRHEVGHWWIEIDGAESYGWWPTEGVRDRPEGFIGDLQEGADAFRIAVVGVEGELNTPREGGTDTRDPHHGHTADEIIHPWTVNSSTDLTDDEIREAIRRFARDYSGDYNWHIGPNCHTFIQEMMRSVGLSTENTAFPGTP